MCDLKAEVLICSRCCAAIRNPGCGGCIHFVQAEKYADKKLKVGCAKRFIARIDPEVNQAVEDALVLSEKRKIAEAEELIKDLLKKHPDIYYVQYAMGTVQALKGNYADSIIYFDKCIEIFPYCGEAWFNRGTSCMRMADMGNALKSFEKAVAFANEEDDYAADAKKQICTLENIIYQSTGLSPEDYVLSSNEFAQAFVAMNARNYNKAIKGFNKVLSFDKNHVQSYGNLGICHAFLGEKQAALAAFDRALAIDPDYGPAMGNKAILLSLKEGEKMNDQQFAVTDYYKEAFNQKRG